MKNILFINKPSGVTSFDVIRLLRRKLGIKKMGHAGTLDPLATGLLIIGVEEGTKELQRFMGMPKEYEVLIEFGKVSTTYDAQGEVTNLAGASNGITQIDFENILKNFTGEILQTPPAFSAKRIKGRRAYDLARRGEKFELKPAKVQIFSIEILEWNWPEVRLRVKCGKGTYIRSLAHDLGQTLGCGGYVKELRRTAIGEVKVSEAEQLE